MRYQKFYTVKEWKRFDRVAERENGNDITFQEIMLKKYEIILTDYKTKKEKFFAVLDKVSAKNINNGITKFNKGMSQFSKVVGSTQPKGKSKKSSFGITQKDYDSLFKSKRKGNSTNFWGEDRKTRKRRNKRKPQDKGPDYSALVGKRKVKLF